VFGSSRLVAIVRFHEGGDVHAALEALAEGGVGAFEITLDTPGALQAIERAAGEGLLVGAGTVLTADHVRAAHDAGASFVVSPGLVPEVVETANDLGVEPLPGVFTPTELLAAQAAGARVLKVFPASSGGPAHIRALRGPFPDAQLVPTGGVGVDDVAAYLAAGAAAVALGGELVGRTAPVSADERAQVAARAARAVAAARATVRFA
jgi:2-dehydro-3-deoxyphosphogluconate aldolase/(4S)-4-hydroxy-2-oxoglutarate aldolase